MQLNRSLRLIYKINTRQLRKAKWNLSLPLHRAITDYPDVVVSISDSQLMRWIDELNGMSDIHMEIQSVQTRLKYEKRKPKCKETKNVICALYARLYELQFQKDYVCVVMNSKKDYDRANQGFKINGISYRRFLGTNGGIKNSTIVYVNADLYPQLKKRLDNGRDKNIPLVPAKLEAYQALTCSGSTPVPPPQGIIVVKDCVTHFKEDVILIDDKKDGEPELSTIKDYLLECDDSDGYGLMLPSYSAKVNRFLNGAKCDHPVSGMNTRYAWNKGMLFTFDFIEFAEKVAGSFYVFDVWGIKRDIRNAEVILTESMLKLWECYDSWEDYYKNCEENHYEFSVTKVCPDELENVRSTNYQFLQSYHFTDEELNALCKPSVDEINEVLGMDYRKSLVFLAGYGLTERKVLSNSLDCSIKSLMVEPELINDQYIHKKIWNMISKRIEMCKRGAIQINANFAIISGDPYALCQSMFGMKITGLLKSGEIYHKYWIDKGSDELVCFRAPMTSHNNIVKLKLNKSADAAYWYRYIATAIILNAWDSTRNSLNGADCDGDLFMTTDNPILLKNTIHTPTIVCVQRKANKVIVNEDDIIAANKIGFTDEIGIVTNHITSMFEVQSGYDADSEEYKALSYRIMCGQLFQQNVIDSIKGIVAKPMPSYWYNMRDNLIRNDDSESDRKLKKFNQKIAAYRKPYFMIYVYPNLKSRNNRYTKNSNNGVLMRFASYGIKNVNDLVNYEPKTNEMVECLSRYNDLVGSNPCTVNRICWLFENEFGTMSQKIGKTDFDYSILKSNVPYLQSDYDAILKVYKKYKSRLDSYYNKISSVKSDSFDIMQQLHFFRNDFKRQCEMICSDEKQLCDIIIDICYKNENSKQFVWDIVGHTILDNLLKAHDYYMTYPEMKDDEGEFRYCGMEFDMKKIKVNKDGLSEDDYT